MISQKPLTQDSHPEASNGGWRNLREIQAAEIKDAVAANTIQKCLGHSTQTDLSQQE